MMRVRETAATRRSDAKACELLEALACGSLVFSEICDLLQMSASGSRKYIRRLAAAGLVEPFSKAAPSGRAVDLAYQVAADPGQIAAEVARLRAGATPPAVHAQVPRVPAKRGCFVHIMGDDIPFQPKRLRAAPAHDELHAAFFGGRR